MYLKKKLPGNHQQISMKINEGDLTRMKEKVSEVAFNKAFEDLMRQHGT